MSDELEWTIPPSLLRNLENAPVDRPVMVLLRHSVRGPLPIGDVGNHVPLTETGWRIARELGQKWGTRLRTLHSSPVRRCIQTANALKEGAGVDTGITESRLLGGPGVYVLDGEVAWNNWEALGHEAVMRHLVSEDEALPGMTRPDEAARCLTRHMLAAAGESNGLHVFVTHDSLVTATVARLQGRPHGPSDWPEFLEGALLWWSEEGLRVRYRDSEHLTEMDGLRGTANPFAT
jgi:broad specificity phosphatase PhoE